MGVEITSRRLLSPTDEKPSVAFRLTSARCVAIETVVYDPDIRGRWPELHLNIPSLDASSGDSDEKPPRVGFVELRIHGVTMPAILDAMLENQTLFKYLAGAVDHIRANPKEKT